MLWFRFVCLISLFTLCFAGHTVELRNNHPFPVRTPVFLDLPLNSGEAGTQEGVPLQRIAGRVAFIADLPPSGRTELRIDPARSPVKSGLLSIKPDNTGVELVFDGKPVGVLSWGIVLQPAPEQPDRKYRSEPVLDFSKTSEPLPLKFSRTEQGPVLDRWSATAKQDGLEIEITLDSFHAGFLDVRARLTNLSAPTDNIYCAVVCQWEQAGVSSRSLCYDNHILPFPDGQQTRFRRGDERHLFVQRGVDWIHSRFETGIDVGWLHEFAPSFTVHKDATDKAPARWIGANTAQLGQEAQAVGRKLISVTEIARPNIRFYRGRLDDRVLPLQGQSIDFSSRLVFSSEFKADEQVDQAFVAYAGYTSRETQPGRTSFAFGVPHVQFGTSYFPYSTLGENFIGLKMPGMDREGFWPLAADTVTGWRLFADQIRRDLRIIKVMGYEVVRLHHLELLEKVDETVQREYLDFLFEQLRRLGFRVLIDVKLPPEKVKPLVSRYRDVLEGVEIDNEVLIFSIPDNGPAYWNEVYKSVKEAAPEIPVHLTGHTNTGAFERLAQLGVKFDRVGAHAYADSLDAIPSTRGFALAVAGYAARKGKPAVITEWNWRGLTRMSPEARARVYAPIFENVLKTRSIPLFCQFQFQETLAVNPGTRKGIRHYEQLWLSRRPKPEALEMMKLIQTYSSPSSPNRQLDITRVEKETRESAGELEFKVTNTSGSRLSLQLSLESDADVETRLKGPASVSLNPGQSVIARVKFRLGQAPGFYHVFLRAKAPDFVRYGWAQIRRPGQPKIVRAENLRVRISSQALDFDLNRPVTVVYGEGCPIVELEAASVVANTLEAATGRPVGFFQLPDLPPGLGKETGLILVGTRTSHGMIDSLHGAMTEEMKDANSFVTAATGGRELIIGGNSPEGVAEAAMDWVLSYWRFARDSGASRVRLVKSELSSGGDASALP